ncbi:hypothetical protein Lepto7375DRAFT_1750 [Leptolyngbya sp. PCC 7375]|nr:hypothetical protein Lepto7375DRAFT_1750 [Leptolyngbya sp. PCC 7375]
MKIKSPEKESGPEGPSVSASIKNILETAKKLSREKQIKLTHLLIDLAASIE